MNKIYATSYKCCRCEKQAEVLVGLADPDATKYPMCRDCAEKWRLEVLMICLEMEEETDEEI